MLKVDFLTPSGPIFSGEATAVQAPGAEGMFTVLKNHAPFISTLQSGKVKIVAADGEKYYEIAGGVAEVFDNRITLLAENAKPVVG
ncbi:MAG: ATP synthase F1 subunit epsilon [Bacteroidia bacterium]|nr:ATP synthase F1 subunit epsilon [Bacteroidia bacterium]MDW8332798.1 ATP synthase F1 subunit epsilon [Bacteroidia bacterium]